MMFLNANQDIGVAGSIGVLATIAVGGVVLLGFSLLIHACMQRQSAALRFIVLQSGVVATLLLPLAMVLPGYPLGFFKSASNPISNPWPSKSAEVSWSTPPLTTQATPIRESIAPTNTVSVPSKFDDVEKLPAVVMVPSVEHDSWLTFTIAACAIIAVWLIGTLVFFMRLLLHSTQMHRVGSCVDSSHWIGLLSRRSLEQVATRVGFRNVGRVRLSITDKIAIPVTMGVFRPQILLPADAPHWSANQLRMVLSHELSHVARRDVMWQWTSEFAKVFYWFNPLLWIVARYAVAEREQACDDRVLRSGERASDYATALLQIATRIAEHGQRVSTSVSIADPPLKTRLQRVLGENVNRQPTTWKSLMTIVLVMAGALYVCVVLRPFQVAQAVDQTAAITMTEKRALKPVEIEPVALPESITGKIIDEAGNAVAGASVSVNFFAEARAVMQLAKRSPQRHWDVVSNDNGEYVIETKGMSALPKASFEVRVEADGFAMGIVWHALSGAQASAGKQFQNAKLTPGRLIAGRVIDPMGKPITQATVRASAKLGELGMWGMLDRSIHSDDDQFHLWVPKDHACVVTFTTEQFAPVQTEIEKSATDFGTLEMVPGTTVDGQLVDQADNPLGGVVVAMESYLQQTAPQQAMHTRDVTITDMQGRFTFPPRIGKATVYVAIEASNNLFGEAAILKTKTALPVVAPFYVKLERQGSAASIKLRATKVVRVSGTARWRNGKPVAGSQVVAQCASPGGSLIIYLGETVTDPNGLYELRFPAAVAQPTVMMFGAEDETGNFQIANPENDITAQRKMSQNLVFSRLDDDVKDADWVLGENAGSDQTMQPVGNELADPELAQLAEQYSDAQKVFTEAIQKAKNEDDQMQVFETLWPANLFADELLKFEGEHRGTLAGIAAIQAIVSMSSSTADVQAPIAKARAVVVDRMIDHYLEHQHLDACIENFGGGPEVARVDELLRLAATSNPFPHVRAAAIWQRAALLSKKLDEYSMIPYGEFLLETQGDRFAKSTRDTFRLRLKSLKNLDLEAARDEAIALLNKLKADYSSVRHPYRVMSSSGIGFVSIDFDKKDVHYPPYGEQADAALFKIRHLAVGQAVPEFEGQSPSGETLRLSDYRDKVVVLIFSADWCGPCKGVYPDLRQLMTEYGDDRFTVLSVMADQQPNTVIDSIEEGEMTWPAIWDGHNGPIATKWHITSRPSIFLIDGEGTIQAKDLQGDFLKQEVKRLVTRL